MSKPSDRSRNLACAFIRKLVIKEGKETNEYMDACAVRYAAGDRQMKVQPDSRYSKIFTLYSVLLQNVQFVSRFKKELPLNLL
jgi:hypothetical protein